MKRLALLAAVVLALTGCASQPPPVSEKVQEYYDKNVANQKPVLPTRAAAPDPATVPSALARLKSPSKKWTIAVLGDSTGNADDEWVYMFADRLSGQYDRPVIIHNWSLEKSAYVDATTVGAGAGAPIVIWNGSASGKGFDYSVKYRDKLVPEQPDLVVISHGHNIGSAQDARSGSYRLVDWSLGAWEKSPAVALVLQNPRLDKNAAVQEQVVAGLREQWAGSKVALLDVHKAFVSRPKLAELVNEDGFHPNAAGEAVWVEAVWSGLRLP